MIDAALARGQEIPELFGEEPTIFPGEEFYLSAFKRLSTCRQLGMGIGPIPWRDIVEYADRAKLSRELSEVFEAVIYAMDDRYREWQGKNSG